CKNVTVFGHNNTRSNAVLLRAAELAAGALFVTGKSKEPPEVWRLELRFSRPFRLNGDRKFDDAWRDFFDQGRKARQELAITYNTGVGGCLKLDCRSFRTALCFD